MSNHDLDASHESRSFVWHDADHFHEKIDKWLSTKDFRQTTIFVSDEVAYQIGDMAREDQRFTIRPADGESYICHYRKIPIYGSCTGRYIAPTSWLLAWYPQTEI